MPLHTVDNSAANAVGGQGSGMAIGGSLKYADDSVKVVTTDATVVYVDGVSMLLVDGGSAFTLASQVKHQRLTVTNRSGSDITVAGHDVLAGRAQDLYYDGTTWYAIEGDSGAVPTLTEGELVFGGPAGELAQDEDLFWNNSTKRLSVGAGSSPVRMVDIESATAGIMRIKNTGNATSIIELDGNPSATGGQTAMIKGLWNGNEVTRIFSRAGDDTTNKDEADLVFRTANGGAIANRLILHQEGHAEFTGDVGIGGEPDEKLHILNGNILLDENTTDQSGILKFDAGAQGTASIHMPAAEASGLWIRSDNGITITGETGQTRVEVLLKDNQSTVFQVAEGTVSSNRDYLLISTLDDSEKIDFGNATTNPDYHFLGSGNVGIGTASPGAKLDVRGSAIFNEDGDVVDFRIEGGTDANLFFADGSTDRIGMGTDTPLRNVHIEGALPIVLIKSPSGVASVIELDANPGTSGANFGKIDFLWNGNPVAQIHADSGDDATNKDEADLIFNTANGGVMATRATIHQEGQVSIDSGNLQIPGIKSGATQGGAGAAANELWKTASHATLPDNVVMIGV